MVRRYKDREYVSHLLRRTYREGGRVRHETVGNISHLPPELIEAVRRGLAGERLVSATDQFTIERSLPHGHVAAAAAMARKLGVVGLLGPPGRHRDLALALVLARVVRPGSKLAVTRWWVDTTLAHDLQVAQASTDEVYAAMDWLVDRQASIEQALARRHLEAGGLVLYDLTSVHYEGRHCPLAALGYPRGGRRGVPQINFGLMTDPEGRPISVEVFPGNTADPTAFVSAAAALRERFSLSQVVVVGDRGMITSARIEALKRVGGMGWVTALRAPQIQALAEAGAVQMSLFDETNLVEIAHPDYPGERLVACRNPAVAEERSRKREDLLRATEKELAKIAEATRRERRALKGKDKIGIRVGRVLSKYKVGKHFELTIADDRFEFARRQERIDTEAALDGVYVIRTSVPPERLAGPEVVRAYKRLAQVERDFRSLKSVDLELRPVRHRLEKRVRAHALICMLASYVVWHLRRAWAPLTFTDEQPPPRDDPVAPATRSGSAAAKASRRQTSEGEPAHSFSTLLEHLGTLIRSDVRVAGAPADATFPQLSTPTPIQRKAFELLEAPVSLRLA
ncbi:MAG: IS1634 family transposase [Actinobacteria bacterium]|nr:IS1634 family transposase [Actinomycetota bacterium]